MADEYVQAITTFNCAVDGTPYAVGAGDTFRTNDPVVKAHKELFGPMKVRDSRREVRRPYGAALLETASAAPGERRTRGRQAAAEPPAAAPEEAPVAATTASEV